MTFRDTSRVYEESILGFDKLEIVGHARERMKMRSVTLRDVIKTLESPDEYVQSSNRKRKRARWHKTSYVSIDVVYEELSDRIRVITVIRMT